MDYKFDDLIWRNFYHDIYFNYHGFETIYQEFSHCTKLGLRQLLFLTNCCYYVFILVIFKVYDADSNGKVSFDDIIEVLRDLSGPFISNKQREAWLLPSLTPSPTYCYLRMQCDLFSVIHSK